MQQFFILLSWRLFTAQHVSSVLLPSSGAQWLQWKSLVVPLYRGDSRAVFGVGPAARLMGGKTPETCWAVNKRQDKMKNSCIRLVIYLNCTMKHGLTNLKFYIWILAHPVCKMWIIQEPKKVALWNKRHFEEKTGECAACLKYSVLIVVEKIYIKCNIWRVAVSPSYM
jgi:hypothetical protein